MWKVAPPVRKEVRGSLSSQAEEMVGQASRSFLQSLGAGMMGAKREQGQRRNSPPERRQREKTERGRRKKKQELESLAYAFHA
jgi:hypothetical protein